MDNLGYFFLFVLLAIILTYFSLPLWRLPAKKKLGGDFCLESAGGMDFCRVDRGAGVGAHSRLWGKRQQTNAARRH
jgi:hypothetical protein